MRPFRLKSRGRIRIGVAPVEPVLIQRPGTRGSHNSRVVPVGFEDQRCSGASNQHFDATP
jgi:hypothetical protein